MAFSMAMGWSEGEEKMHKLMRVPDQDNPTSTMLTPQASFMLQRAPLLAIGTLDAESRPWTTVWGGAPGFSEPIGGDFVGTRTLVDSKYDPVVQSLIGGAEKGEMLQPKGDGKMLAGLAIDLVTRKRVKIAGKMAAGTVREVDIETGDSGALPDDVPKTQDQIQLVTKIEESMGNCPKYLNQYELKPALVTSKLLHEGPGLSSEGRALIDKADMFFLSTATANDMDTNHRGGPPGFVRSISPTCIIYPEYSGNRLYQSLGNLQMNPRIGLTFPDYETGSVLYTTGEAEILVGNDAAQLLPGTNLAVKINLTSTKLISQGLPFRGTLKLNGHSPYNPLLRTLTSEGNIKSRMSTAPTTARLVAKTPLTSTIARFTFEVPGGISYNAGQWAAFSFKDELDTGYSHMRNDDPRSLNDDFVRTFTISSTPSSAPKKEGQFDITIRRVGPVTDFLFAQNPRAGFEVPLLGIGGEFTIMQPAVHEDAGEREKGLTPFIAGGVGITPLLGNIASLRINPQSFKLLWTVRTADSGLVLDTLTRYPQLAGVTDVFVTGQTGDTESAEWEKVKGTGAGISFRRLAKSDLEALEAEKWYLCAGKPFRKQVLQWLEGREVAFEDFDY
ncbi:oxidoreductase [Stagonosporopsis vannaccii]|nr:oxidoreductase [Stagonosporopsis vannaccii]